MKRLMRTVITAALVAGVSPAMAQTVGFADAIKILAASCGKDIDAHCKSATLANFGISQCLDQNAAKVSQKCNVDRVVVEELISARLAAQAAAPKLCNADARQLWANHKPGAGNILRCLLKAERRVSQKCNTAIDLAGYR